MSHAPSPGCGALRLAMVWLLVCGEGAAEVEGFIWDDSGEELSITHRLPDGGGSSTR